jgi:Zn-dependent protease with chaperone function
MILAAIMDYFRIWFSSENLSSTLGYLLAIICGIFLLTELYSIVTQKNEPDMAMLLFAGVLAGVLQGLTSDLLLSILTALCWIMLFSLWTIRESPVWRELMLASFISYVVVIVGRVVQIAMEMRAEARDYGTDGIPYTRWGLTGQQWFGISWNVFIYVFFLLCIIFFGRRFFLVSRLTSPQIIYLLLFALSYFILYQFSTLENLQIYYGGIETELADRLLFASFGTYEIMIITNFVLYLISGPLLHFIFGVKNIKEENFTYLLSKIKQKMIENEVDKKSIDLIDEIDKKISSNGNDEQILKSVEKLNAKSLEIGNKRLTKQIEKLGQKITDRKQHDRILKLVEEVRQKLRIRTKIRVGKVKAPILNAFAFGAFFDKRIAFMSRNLSDLTDDDVKGIAGHELAHASRIHTFWLLIISIITFAITKAINFPATAFDYIFNPDVGLDFLWYYLYNIAILAFSYIFVRFLEGRADKLTLQAGYGKSLAKSLVRLDGFYQGIASEMGLSVYLLTDKEQTKAEKIRFLGDSGRNMYRNYIKPNVSENVVNLIASHPKTAYRVVALTEQEKLKPFKAAMLPFLLSIPFVRRRFIKELQGLRKKVAPVIDETFNDSYPKTGVQNYDHLSHLSYQFEYLKGKDVIAISKADKKDFKIGTVKSIDITNVITSPVILEVKTTDGLEKIPLSDYDFSEIAINQKQVFRNGKIGIIQDFITDNERFSFNVKFIDNGSENIKKLSVPGIPLSYFENIIGKDLLLYQKGITRLARLDSIKFDENSLAKSTFTLTIGNQTKEIEGDKFIVGFKPFDIYMKKGKEELQQPIIGSIKNKHVSLQTKDDLDTLVKGIATEINEETITLEILDEKREIKIDRIEFIYLYEDSIFLYYKASMSFIERITIQLQNRKRLRYIVM